MKKIFLSVFLSTTIIPVSCMEKERATISPAQILSIHPNISYAAPIHMNSIAQPQAQNIPVYGQANQPGWQQLHKIMNTSYQSNQSACTHEVELKPIYRPMNTTTTQQETKPFLRTLTHIKYNQKLIDAIYKETSEIFSNFTLKKITTIVTMMNKAKTEHINETVMGKYAHSLLPKQYDDSALYVTENERVGQVLFFGYLKHYNQTVNTTKEQLPKANDIYRKTSTTNVNNRLAQELNLSSCVNVKSESFIYDEATAIQKYPAFAALKKAVRNNHQKKCYKFLSYIYSEDNTPHNNYLHFSYDELKSEMYTTAINCDVWPSDHKNFLYDMIDIIEAGKALMPAKQEHDFGYDIIESEQTLIGKTLSLANIDHTSKTRKRIGMLCHLIQTYNDQRKTKKSPTMEQYLAYQEYLHLRPFDLIKLSNFAFPDSFDHTLLDVEIYAFDELDKLTDIIGTLRYASDENVQECVDQIYPPRKK